MKTVGAQGQLLRGEGQGTEEGAQMMYVYMYEHPSLYACVDAPDHPQGVYDDGKRQALVMLS